MNARYQMFPIWMIKMSTFNHFLYYMFFFANFQAMMTIALIYLFSEEDCPDWFNIWQPAIAYTEQVTISQLNLYTLGFFIVLSIPFKEKKQVLIDVNRATE